MARVLVVDDVKFISKMLSELFARVGHDVEVATNGREALERVEAEPPDLVVLDVSMPELDGFEVASAIKSAPRTQHTPVLMLTSRTDEGARQRADEIGVDAFVPKPFEGPSLLKQAATLLRSSGPKRRAVPTVSSIHRVLSPGLEVEDNPKALIIRLKQDAVDAEFFAKIEPEIARWKRGVLIDWRAPDAIDDEVADRLVALARRLATEKRALRVLNAPESIARQFATRGAESLLLRGTG